MRSILTKKLLTKLAAISFAALCLSLSACDSAEITGLGDTAAPDTDADTDTGTDNTGDGETLIPDTGNNIISVLQSDGNFETLVTAIDTAGLTELLSSTNTFTLFAPSDSAFDALGADTVDTLLADPDTLSNILLFHVIPDQAVDAAAATDLAGTSVATAIESTVAISSNGESLFVNDATVTRADIEASNGIIHEIDAVLTPPADSGDGDDSNSAGDVFAIVQADGSFDTLTTALEATGLDNILANTDETFTLFAPNDAAFEALGTETVNALLADTDQLTNILLFHVISGQAVDAATAISLTGTTVPSANGDPLAISVNGAELMINDATVVRADINTSNGLVHEIDTVLLPPTEVDLIATLATLPDYSTLLSLLQSADLVTTLEDDKDTFTIFAPNNAAFEALDAALLAGLANDEISLSTVLLGHVADGSLDSAALTELAGQNVSTFGGAERAVAVADGTLTIGGATVILPDVTASNGIIHGIDTVLQ